MKVLILSLALLGNLAVTPAIAMDNADNVLNSNVLSEGHQTLAEEAGATSFEQMLDRTKKNKSKAGKHGGYDKKAAKNRAKGSKCGDKRNRRVRGR